MNNMFEWHFPRFTVLRGDEWQKLSPSKGCFFYSNNPDVTPELLREHYLSYFNAKTSLTAFSNLTSADMLSQATREAMMENGVNPIVLRPGLGTFVTGWLVRGIPELTIPDLILGASLAVEIRKIGLLTIPPNGFPDEYTDAVEKFRSKLLNYTNLLFNSGRATRIESDIDILYTPGNQYFCFQVTVDFHVLTTTRLTLLFKNNQALNNALYGLHEIGGVFNAVLSNNAESYFDDPSVINTFVAPNVYAAV